MPATKAQVTLTGSSREEAVPKTQGKIIPPPSWEGGLLVTFRHKPISSVTGRFETR